jgi:hypothetical protein
MKTPEPLPLTVLTEPTGLQFEDGIEPRLLEIFREPDPAEIEATVDRVLRGTPVWAERFHLSPQRLHLLDWFPFEENSNLLEVGAGCGALTGLLTNRVAQVDALEPNPVRAEVIAHRHRTSDNLSIFVGNLSSAAALGRLYRYVTMIGVLEYAGRFVTMEGAEQESPYVRLLQQARAVLERGGYLVLAIENQLGLKYLAGTPEDHYGVPLVGLEDYMWDAGIRTFGQNELGRMLKTAGFDTFVWYYPFPDYKLPTAIYSDDLTPGSIEHPATMYPTTDYSHPNHQFISEARLARALSRNHLSGTFANSFLVVCRAA